jgi:hypothetical protein
MFIDTIRTTRPAPFGGAGTELAVDTYPLPAPPNGAGGLGSGEL